MSDNDSKADEATRNSSWPERLMRGLQNLVSFCQGNGEPHTRIKNCQPPKGCSTALRPDAGRSKVTYVNWWQGSSFKAAKKRSLYEAWGLVIAVAATVFVSVGYIVRFETEPPDMSATIATSEDESRTKTLEEGSVISLAPSSKVHLDFRESERRVLLLEGQAEFNTTLNSNRPFVVATTLAEAFTIGARFTVALDTDMTVEVYDGEVDVAVPGQPAITVKKGSRYRVYPKYPRTAVAHLGAQTGLTQIDG